jgi:hypothetical protein
MKKILTKLIVERSVRKHPVRKGMKPDPGELGSPIPSR